MQRIEIPEHLFDSIVHGVHIASDTIDYTVSPQMAALAFDAKCWAVRIDFHRTTGFTLAEASSLWEILEEAVIYAMTNNYHERLEHPSLEEFNRDAQFVRQADEFLSLLKSASVAVTK